MKHIGIIAEYNPFHNGHKYQIECIKKLFPDKRIIVAMSGNYVQRGEPAVFSKYVRTNMALLCGADVVIEIPSYFSSASSEYFARAGLFTLAKTGIVDTLCFGAENDDINILEEIAGILINESDNYKLELKRNLSEGSSFPKARSKALKTCFPDKCYSDILNYPNNILAIEYIKAIKQFNLPITPYVIKRSGSAYNDPSIDSNMCSATAIRNAMSIDPDVKSLDGRIPESVLSCICNESTAKPLFFKDFFPFIQYRLLSSDDELSNYYEVTDYISNSIGKFNCIQNDSEQFIDALAGKHITKARIRRCLLNIVFKRTDEMIIEAVRCGYVSSIQLLGFKKDASKLIKLIQDNSDITLINKVSFAKNSLSGAAADAFLHEIFIDDIYRQAFMNRYGIALPSDYEQSVIII